MRLPDEFDDEPKMSMSAVYSIIGVSLFVLAVLVLVLVVNSDGKWGRRKGPVSTASSEENVSLEKDPVSDNDKVLSPDDLDFWDMYPVESDKNGKDSQKENKKEDSKENKDKTNQSAEERQIMVMTKDGEAWVAIDPALPMHSYDFTKLVCQSDRMKYYENGKLVSYLGVEISEEQDYVDFVKIRKSGIDFVMLRVGARGYSTGQLMTDDYFFDNVKRATDAGLEVGVYFFSQAVTEAEAEEEAKYVLELVKDCKITYPIVYRMSYISNDESRIDGLTVDEKTRMANQFLSTVKSAGYIPMMYGTKEWLIRQIDLAKLEGYDFWLSEPGDIPDYPYKFSIWQYATGAYVDGISGAVSLSISFIDYSEK